MFALAFILPLASGMATTCPEYPAPECMDGQMMCSGGIDYYTGCPWPGSCMDMFDSWSHDNDGNPCPMSCPVHCDYSAGEMWCPNPPMNGCWSMGGYCMAPSTDNCPASCPITCGEGEIFMPGEVGPDGCSMPGWCQPDPSYCPHHPVTCADGETLCPGGFDTYTNCPMPDYCLAPYGDCPATCYPPPCNYEAGEQWCDNGYDSNGCWMGSYCAAECAATTAM